MSLPSTGAGAPSDRSMRLVDFPASLQELPWSVVDDGVMGGRSQGRLRAGEGCLVFEGTTNTDGGGFSSIRSGPRRFDLGGQAGIRLRVRGDGRTWTFRLTTSDTRNRRDRPAFWAEFETRSDGWQVVDVPFERFRPRWRGRWLEGPELEPSEIDSLGLMIYDGRDGPFRLEVDWIGAYPAAPSFSMDGLRWQKRPLLLFAEDEGDTRLRRQLAAVEATRDRFEERDMVLIVVVASGSSRAGAQSLTGEDADALRAAYGVERGGFALRLVGKDGGVKRRADDFVPVQALYDQIDAMPMRRDEMRSR